MIRDYNNNNCIVLCCAVVSPGKDVVRDSFPPCLLTCVGVGDNSAAQLPQLHKTLRLCLCMNTREKVMLPVNPSSSSLSLSTRGVTSSMSSFLACHQCYCAGLSVAWGLNLRPLVCGISEARRQGFSPGTPVFIG